MHIEKNFNQIKYKSFLIKDNELLEKYNSVQDKVSKIIKIRFESGPLCNENYLKTKIKSYEEKTDTDFHNDKLLKEGSYFICLSVILIDSVFKWVKAIILKCF